MAKRTRAPRRRKPAGRRTRRPRRRIVSWFRATALIGVLALAAYGAWAVRGYLSSTFEIRHVEVTGTRSLSSASVVDISGIRRGASFLWTSLGKAKERLESDLRIQSAQVHREFPDKLRIEITEREPFAVLQSPTGRHVVDSEGVIFRAIASTNDGVGAGLPTILLNSNSKEGEWASQAVVCILEAADLWPDSVAAAEVSSDGSFSLRLERGLLVRLGAGSVSDLRRKIEFAAEILRRDSELGSRAEYLDVSCTGAPAIRLKGEGDPEAGTDG